MKNWLSQEAIEVARSNAQTIIRKAGELNGWDCIDYPVAETLLALLDARVSSAADKARIAELEAALNAVLDDWDERSRGVREELKSFDGQPYWSPSYAMVSSEVIAAARTALAKGGVR